MSLSHLNQDGEVHMVDICAKDRSCRLARARCSVQFPENILSKIMDEGIEKGDLFAAARMAGIQAAKQTPDIIPLTHPIALDYAGIDLQPQPGENRIKIEATVKASDATGVEMEALNAASAAALTIYDMCKSESKKLNITDLHLVEKKGGKSGHWKSEANS